MKKEFFNEIFFIRKMIISTMMLMSVNAFCQNLIVKPESIVFDKIGKRYFVTCNGNGKIIEIDSLGTKKVFRSGFSNLLGSHLEDSILYVSSNAGVQGFNIFTGEEKFHVKIFGQGQIDGLAADTSGYLYVVDASRRKIYKINIAKKTYTTFITSGLPQWPQDCIFDEDKHLHWYGPVRKVWAERGSITIIEPSAAWDLSAEIEVVLSR